MLDRSLKITEHQWNKEDNALLYVQVLTYNHESYIKECIEGILMQETTFPIHIVVFEDCSTDKTAEILKEYKTKHPKLFTLYLQPVNTYGKDIRQKALQPWYETAKKGKYIAKCEGDDYWTDPLKLQKQVDFLEENEDYGLIHTNYNIINEKNEEVYKINKTQHSGHINNLILKGKYRIATLTVVFRTNLLDKYNSKYYTSMMMGDLPMWLEFSRITKFKYIDDITSTYRILENSASHSTDITKVIKFKEHGIKIREIFARKYNLEYNKHDGLIRLYRGMIKEAYNKKDIKTSSYYYKKIRDISFSASFNLKTLLFYFGVRNKFIDKLIYKLYRIGR